MKTKQLAEPKITADGILKALSKGAKSLTGVAKHLGYKSGSSATLKKISQIVPDIDARLAINTPAKDAVAKPKGTKAGKKVSAENKSSGKAEHPMPDCVPYRPSSGYALAWSILYAHREKGISKADLLSAYKKASGKPDANCGYDVHVVISPREDGSCHRSAGKASQSYWVDREGDFLRLRLVGDGNK